VPEEDMHCTCGCQKQVIRFYRALYQVERLAKKNKLCAEQRHAFRQEKSKPIMQTFKAWLDENVAYVLPQSPLAKAFSYMLNHWEGFIHFLGDGRIEIDNNLTEQEIKPLVIARKNFMFAYSVAGARALCTHFSLLRSALLHQLNPYSYFQVIFQRIPHCQTVEDYVRLLPWNIQIG
jgi:transposase